MKYVYIKGSYGQPVTGYLILVDDNGQCENILISYDKTRLHGLAMQEYNWRDNPWIKSTKIKFEQMELFFNNEINPNYKIEKIYNNMDEFMVDFFDIMLKGC